MHALAVLAAAGLFFLAGNAGAAMDRQAIQDAPVFVDQFGALGDGATDDEPAIIRAANSLGDHGGIIQLSCAKRYYIGRSLSLSMFPGVTLRGCLTAPDDPIAFNGFAGRLATLGTIVRRKEATIFIGRDSGLANLIITQEGVHLAADNADNFAGTAISTSSGGTGQAAVLRDVLVLGAKTCFDDDNGGSRLHINGFFCDGTSGEIFGNSLDTSYVTNVHNWPFVTFDVGSVKPNFRRAGIGIELRGRSDDTVLGEMFDLGHTIGLLFNNAGSGTAHVDHFWADNNDACIKASGGRGISITSFVAYTCGISLWTAPGTEIQVLQSFLVSSDRECIVAGGTLSFALLHLERCGGGGIRMTTPASALSVGFLQVLDLRAPWTISVPPGFTSDHIGIAKLFTDAPAGSSLYAGGGPVDPTLAAGATLDLPQSGDAIRLDGHGVTQTLRGGWGGRMLTVTTASRTAAIASGGNVELNNGVAFGGRTGAVLVLRYDAASSRWREVSRSAP